ncbi:MAG: HD domain-containing protein [Gemmataceae bacterium]|nr:HD domain-containing protein [Gemmataceae bacterium]
MADAGPAPRRYISTLADGDQVEEVYLAADKQLRANRQGNLFLQLELRDRTGMIGTRMWNAQESLFRSFEAGDFVLAKGKVQLFQGSLQMILSGLTRVLPEAVDLGDFMPHTPKDIGQLRERLQTLLRKVQNPHLRALSDCFLGDAALMDRYSRAPAGVRNHHAYVGGLLEHVVSMLEVADRIAPLYPEVDRDLLAMGIFLHDIGKVRELSYDRAFGYTDEGQLVGHLSIGVELLAEKLARVAHLTGEPVPLELVLRLKHLVLSHHGTYEWGSPRLPMTPEAIALHFIDNMDAKIHTFARDIKEDTGGGAWTPFNSSLNRRLFKGGGAGALGDEGEG